MPDTLRDRIKEEVLDGILSMFSENDSVEMAAGYITDAVIEALGLRQEWAVVDADGDHVYVGHLEENADKYTVQPGDHKEIRYVTEWMSPTDDTTGDVNHA